MNAPRHIIGVSVLLLWIPRTLTALPEIHASVGANLYGRGVSETVNQSQIAGGEIDGNLLVPGNEKWEAQLRTGFKFETGASQAVYFDEYGPVQSLRLKTARLTWKPLPSLKLHVGALDQDDLDSPMLVSQKTFPAVREAFTTEWQRITFLLEAQQAVAASGGHVGPTRESSLPKFFYERLRVSAPLDERFTLSTHVAHFSFESLPENVAAHGRFFGNTVYGLASANAGFAYAFRGFETGITLGWNASESFAPSLNFTYLANPEASSATGRAFFLRLAARVKPSRSLILSPGLEAFQIDSDASPSYFNDKRFGHNNRRGWGTSFVVGLPEDHLSFGASVIRANPIHPSPYQSDFTHIQVFLRNDYEIL